MIKKKDKLEEFMPDVTNEQLGQITNMAVELIGLRGKLQELSDQMKALGQEEAELSQHLLPEKMKEFGLSSITLENGLRVSYKHKLKASLTAKRKPEGFAWLRENGFGDLIKPRTVEENVHAGTLSAFVKEQMLKGMAIPTELFGVYEFDQTEIK